ncbi:MAG: retropepsin-like aspartic protease [Pseudomonadota bacterium]
MADHTYRVDKRLIIIPVKIFSSTHFFEANFVLDTGASHTIVDYRIAESLGYSQKDATAQSRVSSSIGKEEGYRIRVHAIETLGKRIDHFEIACHSLLEQGVEGLIGMTFLENFDFCIHPANKIIRI